MHIQRRLVAADSKVRVRPAQVLPVMSCPTGTRTAARPARLRFPSHGFVLRRTGMFTGKLPSWLSRRPGPLVARRGSESPRRWYPPPGSESEAPGPGPRARVLGNLKSKSIVRSHVCAAPGPLEVSLATSPWSRFSGWPRRLLFKHKPQVSILSLAHWHGQAPGTQAAEGVIVTVSDGPGLAAA